MLCYYVMLYLLVIIVVKVLFFVMIVKVVDNGGNLVGFFVNIINSFNDICVLYCLFKDNDFG